MRMPGVVGVISNTRLELDVTVLIIMNFVVENRVVKNGPIVRAANQLIHFVILEVLSTNVVGARGHAPARIVLIDLSHDPIKHSRPRRIYDGKARCQDTILSITINVSSSDATARLFCQEGPPSCIRQLWLQ